MEPISIELQEKISSEVRNYYEYSGRRIIPNCGTSEFASFIGTQNQLVNPILDWAEISNLRFKIVANEKTAGYIHEDLTAFIPGWYCNREALQKFIGVEAPIDIESIGISLANGSFAHEALHAAYTRMNFSDVLMNVRSACRNSLHYSFLGGAFSQLVNLLEDIFIETRRVDAPSEVQNLAYFLQMKNSILFNDVELESSIRQFGESQTFGVFLQLFSHFKNESHRDVMREFFKSFTPLTGLWNAMITLFRFSQGCGPKSGGGRFAYYAAILAELHLIFSQIEPGEFDASEPEEVDDKLLNKLFSMLKGEGFEIELSDEEQHELELAVDIIQNEIEFAKKLDEMKAKAEVKRLVDNEFSTKMHELNTVVLRDVTTFKGKRKVKTSPNNYSFLQTLKQLRSKNHVPGLALRSGQTLVGPRIQRIVTDGKVFANKDFAVDKKSVPEIIILIDWSGSVGIEFGMALLTEAKAMHRSLRDLQIPSAVYLHTGAVDAHGCYQSKPGLFHVASFAMKETNSDIENRFDYATGVELSHNYDGIIYQYLIENCFTSKATSRVVIVLSDGEPSGTGYSGSSAELHTKGVLRKARQKGYAFISMSVKAPVVKNNDNIFGKENNIDASASVKGPFEKLIMRLQSSGDL